MIASLNPRYLAWQLHLLRVDGLRRWVLARAHPSVGWTRFLWRLARA